MDEYFEWMDDMDGWMNGWMNGLIVDG